MIQLIGPTQDGAVATFEVTDRDYVCSATGLTGTEEATIEYSANGVDFEVVSNEDESAAVLKVGRMQIPFVWPGHYKITLPETDEDAAIYLTFRK